MDLERLKKLTRLANNNPNDNEANLAARKVCKILEECSFILAESTIPPRSNYQPVSNPCGNSTEDWMYDYFVNYAKQANQRSYDYETKDNWYEPPPYKNYYKEEPKPKPEKRTLTCRKCKKKEESRFVGDESLFECNNCQWTAYTKTKVNHDW